MKKFLVGFALGLLGLAAAHAASIPLLSSNATNNEPSQIVSTLNGLITTLNASVAPAGAGVPSSAFGVMTSNVIQPLASTEYSAPITGTALTTGSLTVLSLGSATVKFFLVFADSAGKNSYIPVWQ